MDIIKLKHITKQYDDGFVALKDINLTIESGKFYSLLGPSGSGKSTILRIIAGFSQPTEGKVYFDGKDIHYFYGKHPGKLAYEKEGIDREEKWSDLWYIFIPEGFDKTMAQMSNEERENRKKKSAMEEFAKWYKEENNEFKKTN